MEKVRKTLDISKTNDFLGEFNKIKIEFPNYITFVQVTTEKSFIVTMMPSEINAHELPFHKHSMVTNVTYKAISDSKK